MTRELRVVSTSRASDGSFTAISEIGALLRGLHTANPLES
jgi:hypothetical protein